MKNFLVRLLLAAALTLVAFVLASPAPAQQADEDPAPAAPRQQQPAGVAQSPPQSDGYTPPAGDVQTQDALTFTGRVVKEVAKEKEQIVLKDPVTKMSYQFDDPSKAKQFLGKQVKVTGKLDMNSNTIHIDSIEPLL